MTSHRPGNETPAESLAEATRAEPEPITGALPVQAPDAIFLGGADLEMETIRRLAKRLAAAGFVTLHDKRLSWGARASEYRPAIDEALASGQAIVLVELTDDLPPHLPGRDKIASIDHHGVASALPTSLEQVFDRYSASLDALGLTWTRDDALVAANDRGHTPAMAAAGATKDEMLAIRARDRAAQGITAAEEMSGRVAAEAARHDLDGRLTIVDLPHDCTATVTDVLDAHLGGPGYENLLVRCPGKTLFFGAGRCIEALCRLFDDPGQWYGGDLPRRGYFGVPHAITDDEVRPRGKVYDTLAREITMNRSQSTPVHAFHQVLLLPLRIRLDERDSKPEKDSFGGFVEELKSAGWKEKFEQGVISADHSYAEILYFHPPVQRLLFGGNEATADERLSRRFVRHDVQSVDVTLDPEKHPSAFTLRVERLELRLIRPCVAVLIVELSNRDPSPNIVGPPSLSTGVRREPLKLWDVLSLQNELRRTYPPYFKTKSPFHGECPTAMEWTVCSDPQKSARRVVRIISDSQGPGTTWEKLAHDPNKNHLLLYNDWQFLLCGDKTDLLRHFAHVGDDRAPSLSIIVVSNPTDIDHDDVDRLSDYDPPSLSYAPQWRDRERAGKTYDRFSHWGTSYHSNGESFTMLVQGDPHPEDKSEFADLLLDHFRRHYTHLALLAHYHDAALLFFEDRLAAHIGQMAGRDSHSEQVPEDALRRLHVRFLKFASRSYFSEVSPQIQGQELFQLWRRHLGTEARYDRVSRAMQQFLGHIEMRDDKRAADEQVALTKVAEHGIALSLGLATAACVLQWLSIGDHGVIDLISAVCFAVGIYGLWWLFKLFARYLRRS